MKALDRENKSNALFSKLTMNELLVLLLVLSAFVSVFFIAALILLLPFYMLFTKQAKKALPVHKYEYFLLIFAFSAALSTFLNAKDAMLGTFLLKADYLKLLSIGIIILCFDIFFFINIMTKRAYLMGMKLSCILSIGCLVVAIVQKINNLPASIDRPNRFPSMFINENYYGTMIEIMVIVSLFCFFSAKAKWEKILFAISFFSNVAGLWLCQTRTAYIAASISILVFFFFYHRKFSFVLLTALAAFVVLLIYHPTLLPRFDSSGSYLDFRLGIWKAALRCFADHPIFGCGYYSYSGIWEHYSNASFYALHAHNLYVELLLNFGLCGTFSIAAYCIKKMVCNVKAAVKATDKLSLSFMLSIAVGVLVNGMADITLFWPQTGFMIVFILINPKMFISEKNNEEANE